MAAKMAPKKVTMRRGDRKRYSLKRGGAGKGSGGGGG